MNGKNEKKNNGKTEWEMINHKFGLIVMFNTLTSLYILLQR